MKHKQVLAVLLSLLILTLTACGAPAGNSSSPAPSNDSSAPSGGSSAPEMVTVRLGITGGIYEDVWASAKERLKAEGINLEFVQFSDYITPNNALAYGEIDLNAFQHRIYLESDSKANGYAIQNIGNTFITPLNIYSNKIKSVEELKDGDTVAIPNDVTNGGRALKVLEAAGLITLKPEAGFSPTLADIAEYKVAISIQELAANTIPSTLPDLTAGIINGNFAMDFGLKAKEAIFSDTRLDQEEYWNLVAARTADVENPETRAIYEKVMKAYQTPETAKVFSEKFGDYFIPVGWDINLLK